MPAGWTRTTLTDWKIVYGLDVNDVTLGIDDITIFPLGNMPATNYTVGNPTVTGGAAAADNYQFTSLTRDGGGFFEALNFRGGIAGPMNFQVMTDISVEDGKHALNQLTGMSATNPIEIQPDGTTMRTVSGSVNNPNGMIGLNGADYVFFDGRTPAAAAIVPLAQRYLTFRNTSTGGPTFHLRTDATFNTLQYCLIEGRDTDENRGVVMFGAGTATGNDSNLIEYCDIKDDAGNTPRNGIFSAGTSIAIANDLNRVEFNRLYDIFNDNSHPAFVLLSSHSNYWNIANNSFYHTVARTYTNNRRYSLLHINTGVGHTVTSNYFGGSAESAAGTMTLQTADPNYYTRLWAIWIHADQGDTTRIANNFIQNISITTRGNDNVNRQEIFNGIRLSRGTLVASGNEVTNVSVDAAAVTSPIVAGIFLTESGVMGRVIRNNIHAVGLTLSGAASSATNFGIRTNATSAGNILIGNNTVHNLNLTSALSASFGVAGIMVENTGAATNLLVNGNKIYDLKESVAPLAFTVAGIRIDTIGTPLTVSNNMISLGVGEAADLNLAGIYSHSNNASRLRVVYNTVHLAGAVGAGSANSYGFYRGNSSTTPIFIYNNVFQNTRSGGTGGHYAIGSDVAAGWAGSFIDCEGSKTSCNFNACYATATAKLARFVGTDYDFAGWQGLGNEEKGINLNTAGAVAFPAPATAGLSVPAAELRLNGTAYPLLTSLNLDPTLLPTVDRDIDEDYRLGPDIGADEHLVTFTATTNGTWGTTTTWSPVGVPTYGDIVIIPVGSKVTVPDVQAGFFYRITIAGELELVGSGSAYGCFSDLYGGSALRSVGGQVSYPGGATGVFGLASSFEDNSGIPMEGTAHFNVDAVPAPMPCYLSAYVAHFNAQTNNISLFGTAATATIWNATLLNDGVLTQAPGKAFVVGDAATDAGALNLVGAGILVMNNNPLTLEGDLLGTGTITGSATSVLTMNGAGTLTAPLTFTPGGQELHTLLLNRTAGKSTLGSPLLVQNTLTLTNGVLSTSTANMLTLAGTASVTGAIHTTAGGASGGSDASHISGPMRKVLSISMADNTEAFRFPVGNGAYHQPIGVAGVSAAPVTFDAQYISSSAPDRLNVGDPLAVDRLSRVEYWNLNRVAGAAASAYVILHYNTASDAGLTSLEREGLRVMHYPAGGPWTDMGHHAAFRDISLTTPGWVMAATANTTFSPFSWGNGADSNNPLPVTLVQFEARYEKGTGVLLNWKTTTENENEGFVLYRCAGNGAAFEPIASYHTEASLRGAGRSVSPLYYQFTDTKGLEAGATYYYQLGQVNTDGTETRLPVRMVTIDRSGLDLYQNYPNPVMGHTTFRFYLPAPADVSLELLDVMGRPLKLIAAGTLQSGMHEYPYNTEGLVPGVYLARLVAGTEMRLIRVSVVR